VRRGSPLIGPATLRIEPVGNSFTANLIAIERKRMFHRSLITDVESAAIGKGDVLLVDIVAGAESLTGSLTRLGLEEQPLGEGFFTANSRQLGLAEVMIPPDSSSIGRRLSELRLRARHGVEAIGLRRAGRQAREPAHERVRLGDTLLIAGDWGAVRGMQSHPRDYVFLDLPPEIEEIAPAANRAPFAVISLLIMVVLMATGIVPNVIAALIACLLMWITGCLDLTSAYRAIQWPPLILIVGMLPFAAALEKTGGVELAANGLLQVLDGAGPYLLLGGLFLITAVIGMFVSNTATAVLMTPVALAMASSLHASPYPFAMIVALASSAAFMTPVSSPVNTLVVEPGRYRLSDFIKIGAPFTVIVMVISVLLVPLLLPL
jgi:di/tricarboxylate transporter